MGVWTAVEKYDPRTALDNPERDAMQAQIAAKLDEERKRRNLSNRDFVALIKSFANEREFSYRTHYLDDAAKAEPDARHGRFIRTGP